MGLGSPKPHIHNFVLVCLVREKDHVLAVLQRSLMNSVAPFPNRPLTLDRLLLHSCVRQSAFCVPCLFKPMRLHSINYPLCLATFLLI